MTKTQLDKLGERIKKGDVSNENLTLLNEYRRTFGEAYNFIVFKVRNELGQRTTGRRAKSTASITDKLRRESVRLSQVQDIAGCRIVVSDILEQDRVVEQLSKLTDHVSIVDRRTRPSHGYRAVHVIFNVKGQLVEVQVRTRLQHLWAEWCEKLSDIFDPNIKYGQGPDSIVRSLKAFSAAVSEFEKLESELAALKERFSTEELLPEARKLITKLKNDYRRKKANLIVSLKEEVKAVSSLRRKRK